MKITIYQDNALIAKSINVGSSLVGVIIYHLEIEPSDIGQCLLEYLDTVIFPRFVSDQMAHDRLQGLS
jgi:hypothetical protein